MHSSEHDVRDEQQGRGKAAVWVRWMVTEWRWLAGDAEMGLQPELRSALF